MTDQEPRSGRAYAVVTPTRNNADTLAETVRSVTAQSSLPVRWVIVSDGSTDGTDEIVRAAAERHPFIRLIRRSTGESGGFGSKVAAFEVGRAALADVDYEFIGNLDADVAFGPDYFERLLDAFAGDHRLGVAGGSIVEHLGDRTIPQRVSANSVAGAVQLFRRQCFDDTGGFVPLPLGGEDSTVEIMARASGWYVRTLFDLPVIHHGRIGVRNGSSIQARFCKGMTNYILGYDPAFHAAISAYRMRDRPYVVGGISMLAGYAWAALRRPPRALPDSGIRFLRAEQRRRLLGTLALRSPVRVGAFTSRT
ncbi:MAG: glycosyltransferase family 2 protein [Actinomycetota bacterium]|nr:glycosyltransferase family 2 protein [Actinomycetota bacterium]